MWEQRPHIPGFGRPRHLYRQNATSAVLPGFATWRAEWTPCRDKNLIIPHVQITSSGVQSTLSALESI